jgi:ribonuclease R
MLVGFKEGNRYRLGDLLTVKIAKVDLQDRQLYLDVIKNHSVAGEHVGSGKPAKLKPTYKAKRKKERREKKKRKR